MLSFITTVSSSASTRLFLFLHGTAVGEDVFGNRYYTAKARRGTKRERRFVLYNGVADASAVPAEWHGWLHHQTNDLPASENPLRRWWQRTPQPNLTGTPYAYVPPGHITRGGQRDAATGDYQAWTPPQ